MHPYGARIRDNVIAKLPPPIRKFLRTSYVVAFLRDRLLHDLPSAPSSSKGAEVWSPSEDAKFLHSLEILRSAAGKSVLIFYLIYRNGQTSPTHMDQLVKTFSVRYGIPVLSNKGDFTAQDYFRLDGHWTPSGHAKAAHFLYRSLTELDF